MSKKGVFAVAGVIAAVSITLAFLAGDVGVRLVIRELGRGSLEAVFWLFICVAYSSMFPTMALLGNRKKIRSRQFLISVVKSAGIALVALPFIYFFIKSRWEASHHDIGDSWSIAKNSFTFICLFTFAWWMALGLLSLTDKIVDGPQEDDDRSMTA